MIRRRFFLLGAGALITSAFTSKVTAHVEAMGQPLLIAPTKVKRELHVAANGVVTLGPSIWFDDAPVLTWRQYMLAHEPHWFGPDGKDEASAAKEVYPEELDEPMSERCWPMAWEVRASPFAQAYQLLEQINLGPSQRSSGTATIGQGLLFIESFRPGDSSRVVICPDVETISLLQARLIELDEGISIVWDQQEFIGSEWT